MQYFYVKFHSSRENRSSSYRVDVEKNHVSRKTRLKFKAQKWNEYLFIYSQRINETCLIYIKFFFNFTTLEKILKNR